MKSERVVPLHGQELRDFQEQEARQEDAERRMQRHVEQVRSLLPRKCGSGRKSVTHYRTEACWKCGGDGMYRYWTVGSTEVVGRPTPEPILFYRRLELGFCRRCKGVGKIEVMVDGESEPFDRLEIKCGCCGKQLQEGEECQG